VLAEKLGRSTYGGFSIMLVHADIASPHLFHAGSAEQLARYLPDIITGRRIAAVAMTEPNAGSDLASMRTTGRREGPRWKLNGSRIFITNGVHGDIFFVAAKSARRTERANGYLPLIWF
jgi:acyl-CoA dehydrogenase